MNRPTPATAIAVAAFGIARYSGMDAGMRAVPVHKKLFGSQVGTPDTNVTGAVPKT